MKILAVVVLYHPDEAHVLKLIDSLLASGCEVMLVDNALISDALLAVIQQKKHCHYVRSAKNLGTAGAHNMGIEKALAEDFDFVTIFDQDSTISQELIPNLLNTYHELGARGEKVAAVGPSFYDPRVQSAWRNRWHMEKKHHAYAHLIASGMLIPIHALREVGRMDDSLFLDWVDIEWCYRAKSKGYQTFRSATAVMAHTMGEIKPILGGLYWLRYSPVSRNYDFFRNLIRLIRQKQLPFQLAVRAIPKRLLKIFFLKNKQEHIKEAYQGIADGLKNVNRHSKPQ